MTSKFTAIVRIKKSVMQKAESLLAQARNAIRENKSKIENIKQELHSVIVPKSGTISKMRQMQLYKERYRAALNVEQWRLSQNKLLEQNRRAELAEAMREHEKFKFLESDDIEKQVLKLKKEEAKMLDEVGSITYTLRNKGYL